MTLGVGAVSYAGAFSIGVTADRDAFPDLATLVAGMEAELRALSAEPPARVWHPPRE